MGLQKYGALIPRVDYIMGWRFELLSDHIRHHFNFHDPSFLFYIFIFFTSSTSPCIYVTRFSYLSIILIPIWICTFFNSISRKIDHSPWKRVLVLHFQGAYVEIWCKPYYKEIRVLIKPSALCLSFTYIYIYIHGEREREI